MRIRGSGINAAGEAIKASWNLTYLIMSQVPLPTYPYIHLPSTWMIRVRAQLGHELAAVTPGRER